MPARSIEKDDKIKPGTTVGRPDFSTSLIKSCSINDL
jgi:hypothetical protein